MKVVAVLPAYNAQKTLEKVLSNLPKGIFSDIIVSDDCSVDKTWDCITAISHITRIRTPRNLGYGGNVKYCLSKAFAMDADVIVEIHPDGEYGTDGIIPALDKVKNGADLVLGNRFAGQSDGMYWWKAFGTRLLTFIDNIALGIRVPDLHQGFRVYTRNLLESVPYRRGENDYLFSFQIIAQAVGGGFRIETIPVSTHYTGKKRGARTDAAIRYAWETISVIFLFWISKLGFPVALFAQNDDKKTIICPICRNGFLVTKKYDEKQGSIYYCYGCTNAFLQPIPTNMSPWYGQSYYNNINVVRKCKTVLYQLFQSRRLLWVKRYSKKGNVIDVGSGEGEFGKKLGEKYSVTNIEAPFARLVNDKVITTNFLSWETKKRFGVAVFWESLEHVDDPLAYLRHTTSLLNEHGYIFVEYPRFFSLESRLFGRRWYHLDIPRHVTNFTDEGISYVLASSGFNIVEHHPIFAPEYQVIGFAASLLSLTADDLARKTLNPLFFVLFVPVMIISFVIEAILTLFGQSPIGLVIAKKT